jgi:predicted metal-dependent peptidase
MSDNITELLYRIKENIKAIEGGDTEESLLDEVRSDFLGLIELIKLFLISERDSYYGYFLMNMQFRVNFFSNGIAGIKLNEFPPVFEANPLLLCKFTLKEIIYIVCHEIDHVVLNHPAEMVKANPDENPETFYEFNLAADAAVNDRLNHEIIEEKHSFMSEPDGIITSDVLSRMFKLGKICPMENYAYYFKLITGKNKQNPPQSGSGAAKNGGESMMQRQNQKDGTLSAGGESGEQYGNQSADGDSSDGQDNSGQIVTAANCKGKISDHDWKAGNDAEDAAAAVKELVNASVGMMNDESRGMMPGYFMSAVENINKPPVLSWQAILKKYVGTITASKKKTRTRLNRRQPERYDLSGAMDDKVLKIVVAIDTSGSVNDHMIGQIFNEIFAILAKRKHDITVIECDAQVQRVYKAKTPADIKKKVAGRGGTWFTPVIDYVNSDKYFRDALLIYFTDGYGETEIPKPRTYRNIWVVFGNAKHLSVKEPYGIVLTL